MQLKVEIRPISELNVPTNVRMHTAAKVRKLTASVDRYGVIAPIIVRGSDVIDGVARLKAARDTNITTLHVIDIAAMPDPDARALRLALNRLQEEVTWNRDAVASELRALIEVDIELDLTAFETVEIENFLDIGEPAAEVEEIDAAMMDGPTISRRGDIWTLQDGLLRHRLLCADALIPSVLQGLLNGKLAAACFTDPPYNVRIAGHVSSTGRHAEFAQASGEMTAAEFRDFLQRGLKEIEDATANGAVCFVCIDWRHVRDLLTVADAARFELLNLVIWVKSNAGMGSFYRSQHELIAVLRRKGRAHRNNIELGRHGRSRSNVWQYRSVNVKGPERHLLAEHPTVKPSALVADAIRDVTQPGDIVLDTFLGSGTTLIAAQRTQRVCFGVEIEPRYIDLAIRRWQAETGRDAVRHDGVTFTEAEEAAQKLSKASAEEVAI